MKTVKKVLAYITRERNGVTEVLIHKHRDFPEAGLQVPSGTVEDEEDLKTAILREIKEESGLSNLIYVRVLGRYQYTFQEKNQIHDRHFFHFKEDPDNPIPDAWEHKIISEGEDDGLVFIYSWVPINSDFHLSADQGAFLQKLE